jgi:plasmid stabilization system protein ParE
VTQLRVYEDAALSIVEQADYYKEKSGAELALRWESAISEAINSLLRWPEMGSPCRFRSPSLAGLRWASVPGFPKHVVFYRFVQAEEIVLVVQVLHGARDLESLFSDEEDAK